VRGIGFVCVSLLPIWTAPYLEIYLEIYPGVKWDLVRSSG
jgi:hypothetical protein